MTGGDEQRELEQLRAELRELRNEVEELKADTDVPPDPVAEAQAEKGKRRRRFRLIKGGGAVAAGAWIGEHWRQTATGVLAAAATGGAFVVLPVDPGPDEVRIPPATTRPTPAQAATSRPTSGHSTMTIAPTPGGKPDPRIYETPGRTDTTLTPTPRRSSTTSSPPVRRTTQPTRPTQTPTPTPVLPTGTLPPTLPPTLQTDSIAPLATVELNPCLTVLVTICVPSRS